MSTTTANGKEPRYVRNFEAVLKGEPGTMGQLNFIVEKPHAEAILKIMAKLKEDNAFLASDMKFSEVIRFALLYTAANYVEQKP